MSRDPRRYKDPHTFNPERFLGANPEPDVREYVFGFGRRICPGDSLCTFTGILHTKYQIGRILADNNIFSICAGALATFRIEKALDANGKQIEPVVDYSGAFVT
jgi:hypothetical protein